MERESMEFDVVVVGAGPAGLSAAIKLQQLAAETRIVQVGYLWLNMQHLSVHFQKVASCDPAIKLERYLRRVHLSVLKKFSKKLLSTKLFMQIH